VESTADDGDAAATVTHAAKGGDGGKEENIDAAAALPHSVAPVGVPSLYCCGSERSAYTAAPKSLREATGKIKRTATRLLCCRTQGRPWERSACTRAAAPRRRGDATATRLLRLRTRWRPWARQTRRRRGFTASGEIIANRAAARSSADSVRIK
jgi:hypothetical protein